LQLPALCPYCASELEEELFHIKGFQFFGDVDGSNRITHRVVRCQSCGLLHTNPWMTPEGSRVLLEKAGRSYGFCNPVERAHWVCARFPGVRRILDIGCGNGDFPGAFSSEYECAGVDVDEQLLSQARQQYPRAAFFPGSFEPALESFAPEVVTLFHVLEHLPDPLNSLKRLRAYGGKNISLVVEVPVLDRAEETQGRNTGGGPVRVFLLVASHTFHPVHPQSHAEASWLAIG
jgi:SAM-dependent methyltransferase